MNKNNERPKRVEDRQKPVQDEAAERGERLQTGKTIARGGKTEGKVPGASKDPPPEGKS